MRILSLLTKPALLRRRTVAPLVTTLCLSLGVAGAAVATTGSDAVASPRAAAVSTPHHAATRPAMCRPEPPDYPGCTPQQVRPLIRAHFAAEYTGHAYGYRYYRMGQHPRGVIFAHLRPATNAHLAQVYRRAVQRYAAAHTTFVVGDDGERRAVVSYPRFRTWAAFRDNVTSFCSSNVVTRLFPAQYCWVVTKLGQAGAVVARLLASITRIAFSCDGYAVGGFASGAYAAMRLGTGMLRGGFYGGVGTEIGCQATHLWSWVTSLW